MDRKIPRTMELVVLLGTFTALGGCSADRLPIAAPSAPARPTIVSPSSPAPIAVSSNVAIAESEGPPAEPSFVTGAIATNFAPTVDGDLAEWTRAPTVVFHAVDGRTTEVWLSASLDGLVVAARGDTQLLRLELSSPPGKFPPIGFANQFGEEVVTADTCSSTATDGSVRPEAEACLKWFDSAVIRHEELRRWFTRTVQVDGEKVLIEGEAAESTLRRGEGTLEFTLPSRAFPSTDRAPLQDLTLRLWVGSALADVGTVLFDGALAFGDPPNLLRAILEDGGSGDQLRFYQPGPKLDHVAVAYNRPMGYQLEPTEPSPYIGQIGLDRRRFLLPSKGRELLELPRDFGQAGELPGYAWKNADGSLTLLPYVSGWGDFAQAAVVRKSGVDLLFGSQQMQSPFGAGACGACSVGVLRVVRITGDEAEQIVEEYAAPGTGEDVTVTVDRRGRKLSASFACPSEVATKLELVFDPKTETYERRTLPSGVCSD